MSVEFFNNIERVRVWLILENLFFASVESIFVWKTRFCGNFGQDVDFCRKIVKKYDKYGVKFVISDLGLVEIDTHIVGKA